MAPSMCVCVCVCSRVLGGQTRPVWAGPGATSGSGWIVCVCVCVCVVLRWTSMLQTVCVSSGCAERKRKMVRERLVLCHLAPRQSSGLMGLVCKCVCVCVCVCVCDRESVSCGCIWAVQSSISLPWKALMLPFSLSFFFISRSCSLPRCRQRTCERADNKPAGGQRSEVQASGRESDHVRVDFNVSSKKIINEVERKINQSVLPSASSIVSF